MNKRIDILIEGLKIKYEGLIKENLTKEDRKLLNLIAVETIKKFPKNQ